MAWYNNIGDLWGDVKGIATGHNPSNNPPPSPIPAGGPSSGLPLAPSAPSGPGGFASTQPVLPNIPSDATGGGGIDWGNVISKIPGWVVEGLKTGVPAALEWIKNNKDTLIQGAAVADSVYRQMQSDKYAGKAFDLANDSYNARAPLRDAGIQGMLTAGKANPFSVAHQGLQLAPTTTPPATNGSVAGGSRVARAFNLGR